MLDQGFRFLMPGAVRSYPALELGRKLSTAEKVS
jgi:hypothetical protein